MLSHGICRRARMHRNSVAGVLCCQKEEGQKRKKKKSQCATSIVPISQWNYNVHIPNYPPCRTMEDTETEPKQTRPEKDLHELLVAAAHSDPDAAVEELSLKEHRTRAFVGKRTWSDVSTGTPDETGSNAAGQTDDLATFGKSKEPWWPSGDHVLPEYPIESNDENVKGCELHLATLRTARPLTSGLQCSLRCEANHHSAPRNQHVDAHGESSSDDQWAPKVLLPQSHRRAARCHHVQWRCRKPRYNTSSSNIGAGGGPFRTKCTLSSVCIASSNSQADWCALLMPRDGAFEARVSGYVAR